MVASGEVHLFRVVLAASPQCFASLESHLSGDEHARAARFFTEPLRRSFVIARGLLREILGATLGMAPAQVPIAYGASGKPRVPGLYFNLSHSGRQAIYALSPDRELGVDLEQVHALQDRDAVARRFFSAREVADLGLLAEPERQGAFFTCWTRKEAYVKATGAGLGLALDGFRVSLLPGESPALEAPGDLRHWTILDADAGHGYAAALVVEGSRPILRQWSFRDADHCVRHYRRDTLVGPETCVTSRGESAASGA